MGLRAAQNCLKQTHLSVQKIFNVPDKAESACSCPKHQDADFTPVFTVAYAAQSILFIR